MDPLPPKPEPIPARWAHLPESEARRRMAQRAHDQQLSDQQQAIEGTYATDPNYSNKHDW